jgi:vitamin B12 transporter
MASTGFNAPTFNDLYYPFGGNAALRPERVRSGELGLQYAADGQEVRATVFNNRFTDLIGDDAFFNRINIGRARTRGPRRRYRIRRWIQARLRIPPRRRIQVPRRIPPRRRMLPHRCLIRH